MKLKVIIGIMLTLLLISMLTLAFNIQQVASSEQPVLEWDRTYGGTTDDLAWVVVQTDDGGYTIAGWTDSFGAGDEDFWLVKTDSTGNIQWNKTYGGSGTEWYGERAYSMIQTSDGGYAIAGETSSFGAGSRDFWLVKTDSHGTMEWNKTYGGTGIEIAYSVVQTSDGGYAIGGETGPWGNVRDVWLVKTDSHGTMEWNKKYGVGTCDYSTSMVQTTDGGYALAGWTEEQAGAPADFYLVKTDADGTMQWNKTYGGPNRDQAWSVVQTSDGGYILAGHTYSFGVGSGDFWLVKTDSHGTMEWNKTYGGTGIEIAYSVVQTSDEGYVVAGCTRSFGAGLNDFWLTKLSPVEISATVDIDPNTLNLISKGKWITAYITLPEGYNVEDIVLETVEVEGISAAWSEIQDGVYMAKFDRATVRDALTGMIDYGEGVKFYDLELTVTGEVAGTPFEGTDTIVVIWK